MDSSSTYPTIRLEMRDSFAKREKREVEKEEIMGWAEESGKSFRKRLKQAREAAKQRKQEIKNLEKLFGKQKKRWFW